MSIFSREERRIAKLYKELGNTNSNKSQINIAFGELSLIGFHRKGKGEKQVISRMFGSAEALRNSYDELGFIKYLGQLKGNPEYTFYEGNLRLYDSMERMLENVDENKRRIKRVARLNNPFLITKSRR
jgi:hypothetical protein